MTMGILDKKPTCYMAKAALVSAICLYVSGISHRSYNITPEVDSEINWPTAMRKSQKIYTATGEVFIAT